MTSEWKKVSLGDITESVIDYRGKTPKKLGGDWSDTGYRALSAKNIKTGHIVQLDTIRYVDEEMYKKWMKDEIQRGDIIITSEAPFGQIYFWDSDEKIVLSQRLFCVRIKKEYYPQFVYYYMTTDAFQGEMDGRATGTTVVGLRQPELMKCELYCPDYGTQKQIASILSSIDGKININNKINDNLEQQAIVIFNELAKSSNSRKPLSEFIKVKHGYAFKGDYISTEDNGIVLVTPGNFCIGGGFKENKCKYFTGDYPNDYVLQPNSLIVTMTDLSKEADTLGYSALVPQSSERIYLHNQRIGLVEPINADIPLSYVYWYMRSYEYHMSIVGSASGSTVKHTSPGRILEQHIPIPDKNSLEQYAAILDNINIIVSRNNAENAYLDSLREALLPKLMSGEISVDDAVF